MGRRPPCDGCSLAIVVRLEYIETSQLLVQNREGLEAFRLFHLDPKPILHLVLCTIL